MQDTLHQLAVFSLGAVVFMAALIVLIVFLSLLRRLRLSRSAAQIPVPPVQYQAQPPITPALSRDLVERQQDTITKPSPPPESESSEWQIPTRPAAPEQEVIAIAPDSGGSAQEKAVKRLIAHLKSEEATKTS